VFAAASGPPQAGDWDHQWPQDLERLQKKYFPSTDQLVTLRMFSGVSRDNWAVARKLGLCITTEFQGPQAAALLDPLAADKLVGPDNTFNHCGALPANTWEIFVDTGANINVCPRSDAQYALGEGVCRRGTMASSRGRALRARRLAGRVRRTLAEAVVERSSPTVS
jgi:hypothetical protein